MFKKWLDKVWPMCPSGLPHRVRWSVVKSSTDGAYCFHAECLKWKLAQRTQRCPACGSAQIIVYGEANVRVFDCRTCSAVWQRESI